MGAAADAVLLPAFAADSASRSIPIVLSASLRCSVTLIGVAAMAASKYGSRWPWYVTEVVRAVMGRSPVVPLRMKGSTLFSDVRRRGQREDVVVARAQHDARDGAVADEGAVGQEDVLDDVADGQGHDGGVGQVDGALHVGAVVEVRHRQVLHVDAEALEGVETWLVRMSGKEERKTNPSS